MTPKEIQNEIAALQKSIGPSASVHVSVNSRGLPIYAAVYPFGVGRSEGYISVEADDFRSALDALTAKWAEHSSEHRKQTIEKMALEIIRITNAHGSCTDAALRGTFDAGQIASLGAEACTLADQMGGKGPFSIMILRGANAA